MKRYESKNHPGVFATVDQIDEKYKTAMLQFDDGKTQIVLSLHHIQVMLVRRLTSLLHVSFLLKEDTSFTEQRVLQNIYSRTIFLLSA